MSYSVVLCINMFETRKSKWDSSYSCILRNCFKICDDAFEEENDCDTETKILVNDSEIHNRELRSNVQCISSWSSLRTTDNLGLKKPNYLILSVLNGSFVTSHGVIYDPGKYNH